MVYHILILKIHTTCIHVVALCTLLNAMHALEKSLIPLSQISPKCLTTKCNVNDNGQSRVTACGMRYNAVFYEMRVFYIILPQEVKCVAKCGPGFCWMYSLHSLLEDCSYI